MTDKLKYKLFIDIALLKNVSSVYCKRHNRGKFNIQLCTVPEMELQALLSGMKKRKR